MLTAVVSCEFVKLIISTLLLGIEQGGVQAPIECMHKIMSNNPMDMLKMVKKNECHCLLASEGLDSFACTE